MSALPLHPTEARAWLRAQLARPLPHPVGGDAPFYLRAAKQPAAVLIPLVWHTDQPTVLLTRREAGLRHHAGQVCFPGGKPEHHDLNAAATALREAHEEIGLTPQRVQVLGELPPYITITAFSVTPVVGLIAPPFDRHTALTLQAGEVAEVFELPLALALDLPRYERHHYQRDGIEGSYLALRYGGHLVWGATAAMLYNLAQHLQSVP